MTNARAGNISIEQGQILRTSVVQKLRERNMKHSPRGSLFSTRLMALEGWMKWVTRCYPRSARISPCIPILSFVRLCSFAFAIWYWCSPARNSRTGAFVTESTRKNISHGRTRGYPVALTYRTYDFSTISRYFLYNSRLTLSNFRSHRTQLATLPFGWNNISESVSFVPHTFVSFSDGFIATFSREVFH